MAYIFLWNQCNVQQGPLCSFVKPTFTRINTPTGPGIDKGVRRFLEYHLFLTVYIVSHRFADCPYSIKLFLRFADRYSRWDLLITWEDWQKAGLKVAMQVAKY